MRSYDFSPLYRSAIGFDRLARLLNDAQRSDNEMSYPPYNIEQLNENSYRIVMSVAGFSSDEIEIESEQQSLKVSGKKHKETEEVNYLHRGIAESDFEHKFQLADHVKVTNAKLENGLLEINLVREIPEALKPKKIQIISAANDYKLNDKALIDKKAA
jgi:molecular chaperone IbpA